LNAVPTEPSVAVEMKLRTAPAREPGSEASPLGSGRGASPRNPLSLASGAWSPAMIRLIDARVSSINGSEKQKEVIARARDPGLNPDERRKASHDVVLNMMGQSTFHDIDSALAEASEMPPEEAAEVRKAAQWKRSPEMFA
jgi:hypothetical protein